MIRHVVFHKWVSPLHSVVVLATRLPCPSLYSLTVSSHSAATMPRSVTLSTSTHEDGPFELLVDEASLDSTNETLHVPLSESCLFMRLDFRGFQSGACTDSFEVRPGTASEFCAHRVAITLEKSLETGTCSSAPIIPCEEAEEISMPHGLSDSILKLQSEMQAAESEYRQECSRVALYMDERMRLLGKLRPAVTTPPLPIELSASAS